MSKDFIEKTNWFLDLIDNQQNVKKNIAKKEYEEGVKEYNKLFVEKSIKKIFKK